MKKYAIVLLSIFFLTGCGNDQAKKTDQIQTAETSQNYVAEGMAYLQKQDIPRAIQSFDLAIKQDPTNSENYLILGQVYTQLKLYNRAVDTFAAAVRIAPNSGQAHYFLASAKALDGRTEGAIKAAQRSIELFVATKDEENFRKSVALLKTLSDPTEAAVADASQ